jgi:hypothetical protein
MRAVRAKLVVVVLVACVLGAGAWLYSTPFLALRNMRDAASARDAVTLSEYVDYSAVRESLKTALRAKVTPEKPPDNPLLAMGLAFASAVADPMIDRLVTPDSLARAFAGDSPLGSASSGLGPGFDPFGGVQTTSGYESLNTFAVSVKNPALPGAPVSFVLTRNGIAGWKLTSLRLP